jgi:hypothetical protein
MKQTELKGCSTLNLTFFFYQNLIFNEMVVMKAITILEQRTNNSSDDKSSIKTTMIITIGNQ